MEVLLKKREALELREGDLIRVTAPAWQGGWFQCQGAGRYVTRRDLRRLGFLRVCLRLVSLEVRCKSEVVLIIREPLFDGFDLPLALGELAARAPFRIERGLVGDVARQNPRAEAGRILDDERDEIEHLFGLIADVGTRRVAVSAELHRDTKRLEVAGELGDEIVTRPVVGHFQRRDVIDPQH
jgi:hypothetical protein